MENDTFCRLQVACAQGIIGTQNYPDSIVLLNYDDDVFSHDYGHFEEAFGVLTKDDLLQPFLSNHNFRSSIIRADDVCYNI